ncbi:MAG: sodium/solute symporter [Phycisphaerales bacterium]|nr:sodium/solute symporter [Phycisphaerales bacterium]
MMIASGKLNFADHIVVVGYFVVMLGIGAYFYRYMRRMKDYFTGNSAIPWWLSGASFYMSSFSVFGFVVNSALAYKYGWVGITMFWAYIPGTLLCALVFSKRWRRARIDSPVEYMEARYNPAMRQLCAWHGIPVKIVDDALKLVAIGVFLSGSLGLDLKQSMLWSGVIMLAYTFMGGLWAVVVTDFVQFVVMGAAVLILFVLAGVRVGGLHEFVQHAAPGSFDLVSTEYGWTYIAAMVFLYAIAMSSVHWQLIQRFTCVPNEREGRKLGWLVVVLQLVTPVIMFLPGMAARQFIGPDLAEPRDVYPLLCTTLLPAGLLGLTVAAMFAATMSMLSADYNACANVVTNDVYRRLLRPRASQRELVLVGRLVTLVIGVLSLAIAFYVVNQPAGNDSLFRNMVKLFSVATAPVAVPMILGLMSKRLTGLSAVVGLLGGLAVGLYFFFTLADEVALFDVMVKKENLLLFGTALTTTVLMLGVSGLFPQSAAERAHVEPFLERLAAPVGAHRLDREESDPGSAAVSPFGVVGISIGLIGLLMVGVAPFVEGALATGLDLGMGLLMIVAGGLVAWRLGPRHRRGAGAAARAEAADGTAAAAQSVE